MTELDRVEVVFRADRDIESWAERHSRGEVPDRWPYGLDRIAESGALVTPRGLSEPSRVVKAFSTARRWWPRSGGVRPLSGSRDIGFAWDENLAHRMLHLAPHDEMYAGVIWLTDNRPGSPAGTPVSRVRELRRMSGLFVLSSAQCEPLRAMVGPAGPEVHHVTFGIDDAFFPFKPYPERPMLLSAGVDRDRDLRTLGAALETVLRHRPDVEMVVQSRADVVMPRGVRVVPRLTHAQMRDLYERASVVVLATHPNLHVSGMTVALEAMAVGRPVVLSDTPGVTDYVQDGSTGLLARVGDPQSVAERALDLLAEPDTARAMGRLARKEVEARYTTAHLARRLSTLMRLS